jgi:hypothetical protein
MKGALGMEHFSLKRLCGGGLRVSSFTGDPGTYVNKVSGYGHLSPWVPCWGTWNLEGVHLPGLLREKKSISGFLSRTWRPLRF